MLIQEREVKLKKALAKVKSQRELLREERTKKEIPVVAVVGYTNAGKYRQYIGTFICAKH